jgi:hypothetical protein
MKSPFTGKDMEVVYRKKHGLPFIDEIVDTLFNYCCTLPCFHAWLVSCLVWRMEDGVAVKCLMISCLAICCPVEIAGNV